MVFFFSFSPSMNLQGDPSLSDPSVSQSLTFPGSSWCGRELGSPTLQPARRDLQKARQWRV